jgi:disulfide oxidoreductase YuzD
MNFPSIYCKNFFNNPNDILEISKNLNFHYSETGDYPGQRTESLHILNINLFKHINSKIIRLLYPEFNLYEKIQWTAKTYFQKIKYDDVEFNIKNKEYPNKGWVHKDFDSKISAVIYLNKDINNSGTSINIPKKESCTDLLKTQDLKRTYFNKSFNKNDINFFQNYQKQLNTNLSKFDELIIFKSYFNSIAVFDSSEYHSANFDLKENEERLTIISFIDKINTTSFPIPEMNRI